MSGAKACVIEVCQKVCRSFYTMFLEDHCASIWHLLYTNVLVQVHQCVSVSVRYRSGENNYVHGYIYQCMFVFVTTDKCKLSPSQFCSFFLEMCCCFGITC